MEMVSFPQRGQLGHGDTLQRDRPTVVSELSKYAFLSLILAGPKYYQSLCSIGFFEKVFIFLSCHL